MKVRFWGTRGSLPKPGPGTLRYGGNTSCVELCAARGTHIILDCGSGAQDLGQALLKRSERPPSGHILISHTHWDHIQGLPFFAPLFVPGGEWDIYGPHGLYHSLRDALAGQMQSTYFPIALQQFGATTRYHDLVEGAFEIDGVAIRTRYLNHPALTLGYRLEADGLCIVYACDHEPYAKELAGGAGEVVGQDRDHAAFLADADLVIHDAQYTAAEYAGKAGWGHSTVEYVAHLCRLAGVKRVAITHHDPFRTDDALDRIIEQVRCSEGPEIIAAAEGRTIELEPRKSAAPSRPPESTAVPPPSPGLVSQTILLAARDPALDRLISEAVDTDNVGIIRAADGGSAARIAASEQPSLIVLEHSPPAIDAVEVCRTIRAAGAGRPAEVPVIVVGAPVDVPPGREPAVTEWLVRPFSVVYLRTRIQAWLMRTACRWLRAPIPRDEKRRLASLRALGILDTAPEGRFDRITRLAAALFDVPIVLVSLVDEDRQWFKSCHGLDSRETSREASFCAHAILGTDVMVVPDTLIDERFADNPSVTGEPRIRFYAGCPLVLPDGSRVGTLCLVDARPRAFDCNKVGLLQDLGDLVQQELCAVQRSQPAARADGATARSSSGPAG